MIYKAATRRSAAARLLRRVAAINQQTPFQGRRPWLNYFRTFGAHDDLWTARSGAPILNAAPAHLKNLLGAMPEFRSRIRGYFPTWPFEICCIVFSDSWTRLLWSASDLLPRTASAYD